MRGILNEHSGGSMASQDTCVPAGLGSDPAGVTGSPMHSLQDQLQPLLGQVSFG